MSSRKTEILSQVAEHGYVTIEALAGQFGVSAQTVRRDIIDLSDQGLLQRFHGGAGPNDPTKVERFDYRTKLNIGKSGKAEVGRKAAALIEDNSTLYLDVGTTVEACASELAKRPGFTVFTNSVHAAMAFDPDKHEIFVLGGRLAGQDGSLIGGDIIESMAGLHLDYAIIGCSSVDEAGRVMDFDMAKIAIKRAALAVADRSVLLATMSKFNRTALATISQIEMFDEVVNETS